METDKIGIRPFLISFAGLIFIELSAVTAKSWIPCSPMLTVGILRLTEIFVFILIFMKWGKGLASIGLAKQQLLPGLRLGLLWSAGFGMIVMIGFGVLFLCGRNPFGLIHTRFPATSGELILFLLAGGIIGPVAEEIFFRGILYGFLRKWGVFTALFLSSLIFVLIHSRGGFTQAVGGVLFAFAYETEEKLMVPIVIHVLGNMAIFAVSVM